MLWLVSYSLLSLVAPLLWDPASPTRLRVDGLFLRLLPNALARPDYLLGKELAQHLVDLPQRPSATSQDPRLTRIVANISWSTTLSTFPAMSHPLHSNSVFNHFGHRQGSYSLSLLVTYSATCDLLDCGGYLVLEGFARVMLLSCELVSLV